MQRQVYICLSVVVAAVALSVGLIIGIHFRPPEAHTHQEIYQLAGVVAAGIILLALGIFFLLTKTGHKEKIEKKLTGGEK